MNDKTFPDFESAKLYAKKIAIQYKIYVDLRKSGGTWHVYFTIKNKKEADTKLQCIAEESRKALNKKLDEKKKIYEKLSNERLISILKTNKEIDDYEKTIIRLILRKNNGETNFYL